MILRHLPAYLFAFLSALTAPMVTATGLIPVDTLSYQPIVSMSSEDLQKSVSDLTKILNEFRDQRAALVFVKINSISEGNKERTYEEGLNATITAMVYRVFNIYYPDYLNCSITETFWKAIDEFVVDAQQNVASKFDLDNNKEPEDLFLRLENTIKEHFGRLEQERYQFYVGDAVEESIDQNMSFIAVLDRQSQEVLYIYLASEGPVLRSGA